MAVRGLAIIKCPHMQKDKPGKKIDLSEQRPLAGTQGKKKENLWHLSEGATSSGLQGFHFIMQGEN